MYTLPTDFDVSVLKGNELVEICFNANQIRFMFERGTSVTLEGDCILASSNSGETCQISAPIPHTRLFGLLQCDVIEVRLDETRKNLTLEFSNGDRLLLIGDQPYECYHIRFAEREFIV